MEIKRIGILTSGGDAPGMNAALRAVVRACNYYGIEAYGVKRGYQGLLDGEMVELNPRSVSDIIFRGGTILQTARCSAFKTPEGMEQGKKMCDVFGLNALVVIGGDGSFRGALGLSRLGVPIVGIPATIDNDIGCSDYTIGYDTALNTVRDCIDKIKDTAAAHERCSLIEVMGRNAGHIALNSAIACGAEVCLVPERKYDINKDVIRPIIDCRNRGKHHYVVIVAEGVGGTLELAQTIKETTGISTTSTILGHLQRGGTPTVKDRTMASMMGVKAVQCLRAGEANVVIAAKGEQVVAIEIEKALEMTKKIDDDLWLTDEILTL